MEDDKKMREMEKAIKSLHGQIREQRIFFLAVAMMFSFAGISFQMRYSEIRSYYQSSIDLYQEMIEYHQENLDLYREMAEYNHENLDLCQRIIEYHQENLDLTSNIVDIFEKIRPLLEDNFLPLQ